jgi:hypothetical protein
VDLYQALAKRLNTFLRMAIKFEDEKFVSGTLGGVLFKVKNH